MKVTGIRRFVALGIVAALALTGCAREDEELEVDESSPVAEESVEGEAGGQVALGGDGPFIVGALVCSEEGFPTRCGQRCGVGGIHRGGWQRVRCGDL